MSRVQLGRREWNIESNVIQRFIDTGHWPQIEGGSFIAFDLRRDIVSDYDVHEQLRVQLEIAQLLIKYAKPQSELDFMMTSTRVVTATYSPKMVKADSDSRD